MGLEVAPAAEELMPCTQATEKSLVRHSLMHKTFCA